MSRSARFASQRPESVSYASDCCRFDLGGCAFLPSTVLLFFPLHSRLVGHGWHVLDNRQRLGRNAPSGRTPAVRFLVSLWRHTATLLRVRKAPLFTAFLAKRLYLPPSTPAVLALFGLVLTPFKRNRFRVYIMIAVCLPLRFR